MTAPPTAAEPRDLPRLPALLAAVGVLWLLFLFFQDVYIDEVEHMHVAWLIGKLGLRPLHDFFQHHTPLLWHLLSPYYRWGGDGAEGLYYGRALVVACAVAMAAGLYGFARGRAADRASALHGFALALLSLAMTSATLVALLTLRPETLSAALFGLSLLCWARRRLPLDALAGALFGAALYSSPRFAVLGGAFLLLAAKPDALVETSWRRLAALAAGTLAAVVALPVALGDSLQYLRFALLFSALLQQLGDPGLLGRELQQLHLRMPLLLAAPALMVYLYATFFLFLPPAQRRRLEWHLAYLLVVVVASVAVCWPYPYVQNFYPAILLAVVQCAEFGVRLDWRNLPLGRTYLSVTAALCTAATLWNLLVAVAAGETLMDSVLFRRQLQHLLRGGDVVLMSYENHPIAARDASYYGPGLVDSPNRLCLAVAAWEGPPALPRCDYYEALVTRKPAIVDYRFRVMMPWDKRLEASDFVSRNYAAVTSQTLRGKAKVRGILVRPSILERERAAARQ